MLAISSSFLITSTKCSNFQKRIFRSSPILDLIFLFSSFYIIKQVRLERLSAWDSYKRKAELREVFNKNSWRNKAHSKRKEENGTETGTTIVKQNKLDNNRNLIFYWNPDWLRVANRLEGRNKLGTRMECSSMCEVVEWNNGREKNGTIPTFQETSGTAWKAGWERHSLKYIGKTVLFGV